MSVAIFLLIFQSSVDSSYSIIKSREFLEIGDSLLYADGNFSEAYKYYSNVYKKTEDKGKDHIKYEALNRILTVLTYSNAHPELWQEYSDTLLNFSNSKKDSLWYVFHNYRLRMQFSYRQEQYESLKLENWTTLLEESKAFDTELYIEYLIIYAAYLELSRSNFDASITHYLKAIEAIELFKPNRLNVLKFSTIANLGNLFQRIGNYEEALNYYKKASSINALNRISQNEQRFYQWITDCYKEIGQYDSAYHYMQLTHQTLVDSEKRKHDVAISDLEEKYENEKLTNDLSQAEIKRKQFYITSLSLGGLLSLSLIGIWGIRRINRLKQINLKQQIRDTEQQGQLAAINAQLDGEEQERKRVASVLHDGIASHLTAASFHLELSKQNDSTQATNKAAKLIVEAAERTRKLSHELYPPILIKHGLFAAIEALTDSYSNSNIQFTISNQNKELHIPQDLEPKLYFIISEILQNVIKHSQATLCRINLADGSNEMLIVDISDDGIGISDHNKSEGLGLKSISARVASLGGEISIETKKDKGTSIKISVPSTV